MSGDSFGARRAPLAIFVLLLCSLLWAAAASAESADTGEAAQPTEQVETTAPPASQTEAPAPNVRQGAAIVAPKPKPKPPPQPSRGSGGVAPTPGATSSPEPEPEEGTDLPPGPSANAFAIPTLPSPSCSPGAVPAVLVPIYKRASAAYGLGPTGPSVLAAINEIETAFGTNLNVSSAGAVGWMQFMPPTWDAYGVDADGDGVADPYDPVDAIHAAANYLKASGFPEDTYGAIWAYNHADWYVADVLAGARCYAQLGNAAAGALQLEPRLKVFECTAPKRWRKQIPPQYMNAFESAAARYDLGKRGVWVLAAVARLESDFGRGMSAAELREHGPLGLDPTEWSRYAVDGDGDGRLRRADPDDSAATLARLIWSRGDLKAGVFSHNQAEWYVRAVMLEADRLEGRCEVSAVEWSLSLPHAVMAPIRWENLTIVHEAGRRDLETGALDPRIVGLIGAITQSHQVTITSLRSDHSVYTTSGNVSNHYYGRAMDIAAVDGVPCTDTSPTAPCAQLGFTLASLPAPARPTELIYCFDLDGRGPAFAMADHCDHIHAGYNE